MNETSEDSGICYTQGVIFISDHTRRQEQSYGACKAQKKQSS